MAEIKINYYEKVVPSTGKITVLSTTVDACETVIVVECDPEGSPTDIVFDFKYGDAEIFPPTGTISTVTSYTITIHGYQSPFDGSNDVGVRAKLTMNDSSTGDLVDSEGWIRESAGRNCDDVVIDDTIDDTPVDENSTWNDNGGFGNPTWGGFDETH